MIFLSCVVTMPHWTHKFK